MDGLTFEQIEAAGLEDWLIRLGEELRSKHDHGLAKPDPRHSEPFAAGMVWLLQSPCPLRHGPGDRGLPV